MKNRQFFVSNSIQNFVSLTKHSPFQPTYSENDSIINLSSKRVKRVTSCYNSTSKLNASKFINRQAFNSKLYSTKAFNIAVEFRKQNQIQENKYFSFRESQSILNLKKKLQSKQNLLHEFTSSIDNLSHRLRNIYHNLTTTEQSDNSGKLVKQELVLLKEGIERVMKSIFKQIQMNEQKYLKMLFTQKAQQNNNNTNDDFVDIRNLITLKQSLEGSAKTAVKKHVRSVAERADFGTKPSITSSSSKLRQSQIKLQHFQTTNNTNKLKAINEKLSLVQFENKKHILRIQSLEAQNSRLKQKITSLSIDIGKMNQKVQKVKQIQQTYNFKIKKLKQQLQVAHIVKEQNLAEKMRYIMQNQK